MSTVRKRVQKFSYAATAHVGLEVLKVLEVLHDEGYLHRDVKPSNILFGAPEEVTTSFGFSFL